MTVHDVGRTTDDFPFFVMEYVEGERLDDRLKAGLMPPQQAAELLAQVADAVNYAHDQGLVHRDLKPANILLDDQDVPHVTDFGLALHTGRQQLHEGEVSGTAAYMSPEQIRGDVDQLDGRSDVWGLGVVLYEMLAGTRPFQGETREELFGQILERQPPSPHELQPDVPAELERIVLRCLAKDHNDRYATAGDIGLSAAVFTQLQDRCFLANLLSRTC